jgi:hypothetical protein
MLDTVQYVSSCQHVGFILPSTEFPLYLNIIKIITISYVLFELLIYRDI